MASKEERQRVIREASQRVKTGPVWIRRAVERWTIELDAYEAANLKALLGATGYNGDAKPGLPQAQTGDWVGQIYWKLPNLDYRPNATAQEIADRALQAERQRREEAEQAADELAEAVEEMRDLEMRAPDVHQFYYLAFQEISQKVYDAAAHYKEARR